LQSDKPAFYQIEVQGTLSSSWSDYLGGLAISVNDEQDARSTLLEGEFMDQAALIGVIDSLYNLGFPLIRVLYQPIASQ